MLWNALKAHWRIAAAAIAVFFAWVIYKVVQKRKSNLNLPVEIEAIRAEQTAADLRVRTGEARALVAIQSIYEAQKTKMSEAEAHEAEQLKTDPERLAGYLVRAGSARLGRPTNLSELANMRP
jgi:hypothetical protein